MKRILLIEDEPALQEMFSRLLKRRGYAVRKASSGAEGLKRARAGKPDLIITDWALGAGLQGVDLCMSLKAEAATRSIPIVVLTGIKQQFEDELTALQKGADLFLTKDQILGSAAKTARLLGYIRSLLKRPFTASDRSKGLLRRPGLAIDLAEHTVQTKNELVADLSTKQFDLLYLLAKKHPRAVSRRFLLRAVWKNRVRDREVDVAISRLKDRIESGKGRVIESVFGKGYRLAVSPSISEKTASENRVQQVLQERP